MKTQERMQGFSAGKLSFAHNKQTNKQERFITAGTLC